MDEYISREALLTEIAADYGNWIACNDTDESYRQGVKDNYSDTIRLINDIPAADVQPAKHGRWIENSDPGQNINEHYMCSECGCTFHNWANDNYCPNCGSKNRMDGDKDNNVRNLTDEETANYESWIESEAKDTGVNIMEGDSE